MVVKSIGIGYTRGAPLFTRYPDESHMSHVEILTTFLATVKDAREYKRALAVRLVFLDVEPTTIATLLNVSQAFVSKWKQNYLTHGVDVFSVKYHGYEGYVTSEQRQAMLDWIRTRDAWDIAGLRTFIHETYGIIFKSPQSYYDLFDAAGVTWKRASTQHPNKDPHAIAAKKKN